MTEFNELPKSVKKTIRYILQDANPEKLNEIEKSLLRAVDQRRQTLQEK